MSKISALAMTLIDVRFGIDEVDHWGVNGSMYESGLVHQNSLSNLVVGTSITITDEIIRAVDGSN
jgi:hypothetical protein